MPIKPIDFEGMVNEIVSVKEKYGIPKAMYFVPDRLEITLQRIGEDKFSLDYQETFSYLPPLYLGLAIQSVVNFMNQVGIPKENITVLDDGVKLKYVGSFVSTVSPVLLEILIQKRTEESEIVSIIEGLVKTHKVFSRLSDFHRNWNNDIAKKFEGFIEKIYRIMLDHPSARSEMEAIARKYTGSSV